MASGAPQVVCGDPGLVLRLFAKPELLRAIPVAPAPYWELKAALAP
jgi:hypothetical protein